MSAAVKRYISNSISGSIDIDCLLQNKRKVNTLLEGDISTNTPQLVNKIVVQSNIAGSFSFSNLLLSAKRLVESEIDSSFILNPTILHRKALIESLLSGGINLSSTIEVKKFISTLLSGELTLGDLDLSIIWNEIALLFSEIITEEKKSSTMILEDLVEGDIV